MLTPIFRSISISAATIFAVLLGIVTTGSLGSSTPIATEIANPQLGKPVRIDLESKAVFSTERLEITVSRIRDSRCPKDIDCYWGGEAQVTLNLQQAGKNIGDLDLTLGVGNPDYPYPNNIKQVRGYYVRLLAVDPYPATRDPKKVDPKVVTHTVTLQVQKTPFKLKDAN
jgi:hypothetical protein